MNVLLMIEAREMRERMARKSESWAEREQRLAEGRSSPTGYPIKRLPDDGLTIPPPPRKSAPLNIKLMVACGTIKE